MPLLDAPPPPLMHTHYRHLRRGALVCLLLLMLVGLIRWGQGAMAPTYDEQNHVTRGIAILRTGDWRLSLHHPPFANVLEALPVAWAHRDGFSTAIPEWQTLAIWPIAHTTIWQHPQDGLWLIVMARLPVLLFTLLFAGIVFLWAQQLFGYWGGLVALTLVILDPTVLAHGGLATTDMPVAAMVLLALYLFDRTRHHPTRWRVIGTGAVIGLTLATKFSGLILLPITLVLIGWPRAPWGAWQARLRLLVTLWLVAGVTLWGCYGFAIEPLGKIPGHPLPRTASLVERIPVPALQYFRGVKTILLEKARHSTYLLGKTSTTGTNWWYYSLVVLAVKTPLPTLLVWLGVGGALLWPAVRRRLGHDEEPRTIEVALGLYLLVAAGSGSMNQGIRHLLPMTGLLAILMGAVIPLCHRVCWRIGGVILLLLLQAWSVLRDAPDFLAYFNEAAGGPARGYRLVAGPNCDWGQDINRLAAWQRQHDDAPLAFSYFGTTPPEAYGLRCTPLLGTGLMHERGERLNSSTYRGYVAISVTNLVNDASLCGVDYRPLLRQRPVGRAGYSILIYRMP